MLNNDKGFELAVILAAARVADWKDQAGASVSVHDRIVEEIRRCYKTVKAASDVM